MESITGPERPPRRAVKFRLSLDGAGSTGVRKELGELF